MVVGALAVEAYLHVDLAEAMQLAAPHGIGGGTLFYIHAGIALVAAILLLVTGSRFGYAVAGLAALSALVPVLLYSFVNVPALGPIPSGAHSSRVRNVPMSPATRSASWPATACEAPS